MMNEHGKSDRSVVPAKSPNKAGRPAAEGTERSGLTNGNPQQQNASRTPSRTDAPSALQRVRQAASSKDKETRFTALLHHIHNLETLRMAYFCLKKEAAPGVDGETWRHYGETLEDNLQDLSHRLQRAYRDFSKAAFEEDKVVVATCIRKPGWLPISFPSQRFCPSFVAITVRSETRKKLLFPRTKAFPELASTPCYTNCARFSKGLLKSSATLP